MIAEASDMRDEALGWVVRLNEQDFDDWDAFDAWLARDPRHGDVYGALALADQDIASELDRPVEPDVERDDDALRYRLPRRRIAAAAAAAAVLIATIGMGLIVPSSAPAPLRIETAAGGRKLVTLPDGSRIAVNGDTVLTLAGADRRRVALLHGQATFDIVHDPRRDFSVRAGGATITDIGTVFDVEDDDGDVRIGVARGSVRYAAANGSVPLEAGQSLTAAADGSDVVVRSVPTERIGSWRRGRFYYDRAPLGRVATEISRATGIAIVATPAVAGRSFTGVITVTGDRKALYGRLGALLDVRIVKQGGTWALRDAKARAS